MTRNASDVLEQEFLVVRAKILEIGAFFDRLNSAETAACDQRKLTLLLDACKLLCTDGREKAKQIQLLFSREYDQSWREKFGV